MGSAPLLLPGHRAHQSERTVEPRTRQATAGVRGQGSRGDWEAPGAQASLGVVSVHTALWPGGVSAGTWHLCALQTLGWPGAPTHPVQLPRCALLLDLVIFPQRFWT